MSNNNHLNFLAQKKGFKDRNDYERSCYLKRFGCMMKLNKNCAPYLGIYIAERLLPDIFENPVMMPYGNTGYDAICKNNYKIDVKSSVCLPCSCTTNYWQFVIRNNKIADAFLLIAFNNRSDLNIQHIWLIPGNEIIRNRKLNEFRSLGITDKENKLIEFSNYELNNKKDKANIVCDMFKNGVLK